jgi:hypothetical protein
LAVVLVAFVAIGTLAGCTPGSGYTGSPAQQVSEWASVATVSSNDELVVEDIVAIRRSVKAGLIKYLTSNCAGLVSDAGTAYGNLPTPDNTLTNELNVAYEDFANAGSSCAAAQKIHSKTVTAALRTIAQGVVSLDQATRLLAADGVH